MTHPVCNTAEGRLLALAIASGVVGMLCALKYKWQTKQDNDDPATRLLL